MTYILRALRYHQPIHSEHNTLEDAISKAIQWSPDYQDGQTIGYAAVIDIIDENGSIVMSEEELSERLSDL